MSLSTFGGEINPHRNFDFVCVVLAWNVCAKTKEQVVLCKGVNEKRVVGLAYLGSFAQQQLMVLLVGVARLVFLETVDELPPKLERTLETYYW